MPKQFEIVAKDLKHGLYFIGFGLFGLFLFAYTCSISGAVVSPGTVVVQNSPKKVQHLTGGKITRIFVVDGDHVERIKFLSSWTIYKLSQSCFQSKMN